MNPAEKPSAAPRQSRGNRRESRELGAVRCSSRRRRGRARRGQSGFSQIQFGWRREQVFECVNCYDQNM